MTNYHEYMNTYYPDDDGPWCCTVDECGEPAVVDSEDDSLCLHHCYIYTICRVCGGVDFDISAGCVCRHCKIESQEATSTIADPYDDLPF